jgi:hypothetical protein
LALFGFPRPNAAIFRRQKECAQMDISVARQIGDERDNRQRTPEKRTALDIRAANQIDANFVWLAARDDGSAQHWAKDA